MRTPAPMWQLPLLLALPTCSQQPPAVETQVTVDVRLDEPESGIVRVRTDIPRARFGEASALVLRFRDSRRHPNALKDLAARSLEERLPVVAGLEDGQETRTVDVSGATSSVVVTYSVDPTFYPPGPRSGNPADARGRLTEAAAVLRTSSVFPVVDPPFDSAHVRFTLPAGWVTLTPWERNGDGFTVSSADLTHVDYLGFGPFDVREARVGKVAVRVSTPRRDPGLRVEQVIRLVRYDLNLIGGTALEGTGARSVIIVPPRFMRGGAAGTRTIVQGPSAIILAHEVVHWWTHSDLVLAEARWFSEGFTNYYGVKSARESGLISEADAVGCLADLDGEMRYLELDGVESLTNASRRYGDERRAQRLVYSKGTLFAHFLDQELLNQGLGLDAVFRTILSRKRRDLSNADLRRFFTTAYGNRVGATFDSVVVLATALPDLGLGRSTGRSGCARILPNR